MKEHPAGRLLSIGAFAALAGLSVKALRYYDAAGLLAPAWVDPSTGYRHYALTQARTATIIKSLRTVDMPIEDIAALLRADEEGGAHEVLHRHRAGLEDRRLAAEQMLAFVDRLLDQGATMPYDIFLTDRPAQLAVTVRTTMPVDEAARISQLHAQVAMHLIDAGFQDFGPAIGLTHRWATETDDTIDVEAGSCVPHLIDSSGAFTCRTVPGGRFASTEHLGPYEDLWQAHVALEQWLTDRGLQQSGPTTVISIAHPGNTTDPTAYRTEIHVPVGETTKAE